MYLTLLSEKINIFGRQQQNALILQVPSVDLLDHVTEKQGL
jgi:hypothetical protein